MLDYRGRVAEATGANIFLVLDDGKLHTPVPDCFLDGITRRTVIDLARQNGFEVIERAVMPEELAAATDVFLTGTAAEVTPVGRHSTTRLTPSARSRERSWTITKSSSATSPGMRRPPPEPSTHRRMGYGITIGGT